MIKRINKWNNVLRTENLVNKISAIISLRSVGKTILSTNIIVLSLGIITARLKYIKYGIAVVEIKG